VRQERWRHRTTVAILMIALLFPVSASEAKAEAPSRPLICDLMVDDFSQSKIGQFPAEWQPKDEKERAQAEHTYRVRSVGGRRVLHATFHDEAVTIGRSLPKQWDPARYPILQWEWAVLQLNSRSGVRRGQGRGR